jgi:hypothetical protein
MVNVSSILTVTTTNFLKYIIMTITNKIQKLYNKLDFLQDNDRWVQYREVYKEITELEKLRDESYSN